MVRCSLENAASVAKTFLTSDVVVTEIKGEGGSGRLGFWVHMPFAHNTPVCCYVILQWWFQFCRLPVVGAAALA